VAIAAPENRLKVKQASKNIVIWRSTSGEGVPLQPCRAVDDFCPAARGREPHWCFSVVLGFPYTRGLLPVVLQGLEFHTMQCTVPEYVIFRRQSSPYMVLEDRLFNFLFLSQSQVLNFFYCGLNCFSRGYVSIEVVFGRT